MTSSYHLKNIRTLLHEGFTVEELQRLCYEEVAFRPVHDQLTQYSGKVDIIDRLFIYADQKLYFDTLLSWAKEHNPARYEKHQPYYTNDPTTFVDELGDHYNNHVMRKQALATVMVRDKCAKDEFDVFLCHHKTDKQVVQEIESQLRAHGIRPWELRPGLPWQRLLEDQIEQIKSAAVFVGQKGIGPWQDQEIDVFLREFVDLGCPVIPVLLPQALQQPKLPIFLSGVVWVDFRQSEPDPLAQLIWGITGWSGRD